MIEEFGRGPRVCNVAALAVRTSTWLREEEATVGVPIVCPRCGLRRAPDALSHRGGAHASTSLPSVIQIRHDSGITGPCASLLLLTLNLGRFPAPAIIVFANNCFAITCHAGHAVIIFAAIFAGLVASSLIT